MTTKNKYPGYVQFVKTQKPAEHPDFEILEVLEEERAESLRDAIGHRVVKEAYGNGERVEPVYADKVFITKGPVFLMGLPEQVRERQLEEAVHNLQERAGDLLQERNAAHSELKTARELSEKLAKEAEALRSSLSEMTTQRNNGLTALRKMEQDFGKLRRVLGEKAVTEALEEKKQP